MAASLLKLVMALNLDIESKKIRLKNYYHSLCNSYDSDSAHYQVVLYGINTKAERSFKVYHKNREIHEIDELIGCDYILVVEDKLIYDEWSTYAAVYPIESIAEYRVQLKFAEETRWEEYQHCTEYAKPEHILGEDAAFEDDADDMDVVEDDTHLYEDMYKSVFKD